MFVILLPPHFPPPPCPLCLVIYVTRNADRRAEFDADRRAYRDRPFNLKK